MDLEGIIFTSLLAAASKIYPRDFPADLNCEYYCQCFGIDFDDSPE